MHRACCESCARGAACESGCGGHPSPHPVVGACDVDAIVARGEAGFEGRDRATARVAGWGPFQGVADALRTPGPGGAAAAFDRAIDPVVDRVLPLVPLVGPAIQEGHRARMDAMYGRGGAVDPDTYQRPGAAPISAPDKSAAVRRMQALFRAKRRGDPGARERVVALKEAAARGDASARYDWHMYVAVAHDDYGRAAREARS